MVVMPDAVLERTVEGILGSAFGAAGQRCMAGSVVVTVGEAHERLLPALTEAARRLRVGDGAQAETDLGPVISCAARDRIAGWVQRAIDDGARAVLDGRATRRRGPGRRRCIPRSDDPRRGASGDGGRPGGGVRAGAGGDPRAQDLDGALEIVNASRFGNGVSIFTEDGAAVRRLRHDVQVGMVGVNIGVAAPVAFFPFSGWKDSFLGDLHAHGPDAVDFFTRKKTVTSRFFSAGDGHGGYFVER